MLTDGLGVSYQVVPGIIVRWPNGMAAGRTHSACLVHESAGFESPDRMIEMRGGKQRTTIGMLLGPERGMSYRNGRGLARSEGTPAP